MKKSTLVISLFLLILLCFAFPKLAMACSVHFNGLRENQPLTMTFIFDASDTGKTYQLLGIDPNNNDYMDQNYPVNAAGTLTQTVTNSAMKGNYSVRVNDLSRGFQICRADINIIPLAAPPPVGIPPVKIINPKGWLNLINPGFGAVGANLGANFGLNFFTNNVANFIISAALFIIFTASLIFLLIGGIMWITSGGNKEGAAKAKNTVTYAIVGLALGLASFIIVNILGTFFGLNLVGP